MLEKNEQESFKVPETHQKLAMERFDNLRKDPDRLLDLDETFVDIQGITDW